MSIISRLASQPGLITKLLQKSEMIALNRLSKIQLPDNVKDPVKYSYEKISQNRDVISELEVMMKENKEPDFITTFSQISWF